MATTSIIAQKGTDPLNSGQEFLEAGNFVVFSVNRVAFCGHLIGWIRTEILS